MGREMMRNYWRWLLAAALLFAPACATAQQQPVQQVAQADGAHDFDWEIGTWRTHLRRLQNPLSGSNTWVEYEGTSIVHGFLDRRANLVELSVQGPAGSIEGMSLRLYNPQTRQWSLHYASVRSGELTPPVVGSFVNGRGEFYADDTFDGRPIRVRFVISDITENSARFEQAFSADGGQTWEVNWIAVDTRMH
jgi:hypothetical protein